jgi:hypothetical protein
MQHTLTQGAGKRQKCLLHELEKQAILEPSVLRLEKEAERIGAKLNGYARRKLNKLYEQKKEIYVCFG